MTRTRRRVDWLKLSAWALMLWFVVTTYVGSYVLVRELWMVVTGHVH